MPVTVLASSCFVLVRSGSAARRQSIDLSGFSVVSNFAGGDRRREGAWVTREGAAEKEPLTAMWPTRRFERHAARPQDIPAQRDEALPGARTHTEMKRTDLRHISCRIGHRTVLLLGMWHTNARRPTVTVGLSLETVGG